MSGSNVLSGGAGNDEIIGGTGFDDITGGVGDDDLSDIGGGAVYRFSAGFGQDYITHQRDPLATSAIEFDATIPASAIVVERQGEGGDIILKVDGTDDTITYSSFIFGEVGEGFGIDEVRFADGTIWSEGRCRFDGC